MSLDYFRYANFICKSEKSLDSEARNRKVWCRIESEFLIIIDPVQTKKIGGVNGSITTQIDLLHEEAARLSGRDWKDQKIVAFTYQRNTMNPRQVGFESACFDIEVIAMEPKR